MSIARSMNCVVPCDWCRVPCASSISRTLPNYFAPGDHAVVCPTCYRDAYKLEPVSPSILRDIEIQVNRAPMFSLVEGLQTIGAFAIAILIMTAIYLACYGCYVLIIFVFSGGSR